MDGSSLGSSDKLGAEDSQSVGCIDTLGNADGSSLGSNDILGASDGISLGCTESLGASDGSLLGSDDKLANPTDAAWLRDQLGDNVVFYEEYKLGHLSFTMALDMSWFTNDIVPLI